MAFTHSTSEVLVARIDAETGPVGGYWVTLITQGTNCVVDSTTKMLGGPQTELTIWMLTTGTVAVGDLLDVDLQAS